MPCPSTIIGDTYCPIGWPSWTSDSSSLKLGKIRTWCQLLIGATGSSILSGLGEDVTWETGKETLLSHLGIGSKKDEAWAALKTLKKAPKK